MKKYTIDFRNISNMEEAHNILKDSMGFPEYYGANLDALNDCLAEIEKDHIVYIIVNKNGFKGLDSILQVFDDNSINYERIIEI